MSTCSSCMPGTGEIRRTCPVVVPGLLTNYGGACSSHGQLLSLVPTKNTSFSNYESRMWLQHNGLNVMQMERQRAENGLLQCNPCKRDPRTEGTMLKEQVVVKCDAISCNNASQVTPHGLGYGRQQFF